MIHSLTSLPVIAAVLGIHSMAASGFSDESQPTPEHPVLMRVNVADSKPAQDWADAVEKNSGDRIVVRLQHRYIDYTDLDKPVPRDETGFYLIQKGRLEAGVTGHFFWYQVTHEFPEMAICVRPFQFPNDQGIISFPTSEAASLLVRDAESKGFHIFGWLPIGTTNAFMTNTPGPLRSPDGFRGLRIRSTGEGMNEGLAGLGAIPITQHGAEAANKALKSGELDGMYLGLVANAYPPPRQFHKVTKYATVTHYAAEFFVAYANLDFWNRLSPELRGVIEDATRKWEKDTLDAQNKANADAMGKIEAENGAKVYVNTPEEMAAIGKVARPAFDDYFLKAAGPGGKRILEALDRRQ